MLEQYGLIVAEWVEDGKLRRCPTVTKPRSKNGWYIVFPDGGYLCGNHETGEEWSERGTKEVDYTALRRKQEEYKANKEKAQLAAADTAVNYLTACDSNGHSEYLERKKIQANGAKFKGSKLIIPIQDSEGKIWNYQTIFADGTKLFLRDAKIIGCYFKIGFTDNVKRVVVCEGFATGASIYQATGLPVVVAFNAGNLKPVADNLPYSDIIIAADNDKSGAGERYAKESGYSYVMPAVEGWDYSDYLLNGKDFKSDFIADNTNKADNSAINIGGLVGEIADWITEMAIRPQPELSLAAALAFMSMVKGQRVRGRTNLRTNSLILSLAPTASGKEHPQYAISNLAAACGLSKHLMGRPTSGSGLLTGLIKSGSCALLTVDEMGRYISNITMKGAGGYQREIADYMVELFSCANRTFYGRQYANEKQNPQIMIEQPHFCCFGSTVQERLQAACTSAEVVDGFLNRWVVFSTLQRPKKRRKMAEGEPPQILIDKILAWMDKNPIIQDSYGNKNPRQVEFTPEAWDIFVKFDDDMEAAIDKAVYPADRLYSRSSEHAEKIAMVLADDFIGVPEIKSAIKIVERSNQHIMSFAGMIADNVQEQDFIRVREIIAEAGEVARGRLTYKSQFVQGGARRISEIINVLIEENQIVERKQRNKILYKWIG